MALVRSNDLAAQRPPHQLLGQLDLQRAVPHAPAVRCSGGLDGASMDDGRFPLIVNLSNNDLTRLLDEPQDDS